MSTSQNREKFCDFIVIIVSSNTLLPMLIGTAPNFHYLIGGKKHTMVCYSIITVWVFTVIIVNQFRYSQGINIFGILDVERNVYSPQT